MLSNYTHCTAQKLYENVDAWHRACRKVLQSVKQPCRWKVAAVHLPLGVLTRRHRVATAIHQLLQRCAWQKQQRWHRVLENRDDCNYVSLLSSFYHGKSVSRTRPCAPIGLTHSFHSYHAPQNPRNFAMEKGSCFSNTLSIKHIAESNPF